MQLDTIQPIEIIIMQIYEVYRHLHMTQWNVHK